MIWQLSQIKKQHLLARYMPRYTYGPRKAQFSITSLERLEPLIVLVLRKHELPQTSKSIFPILNAASLNPSLKLSE